MFEKGVPEETTGESRGRAECTEHCPMAQEGGWMGWRVEDEMDIRRFSQP